MMMVLRRDQWSPTGHAGNSSPLSLHTCRRSKCRMDQCRRGCMHASSTATDAHVAPFTRPLESSFLPPPLCASFYFSPFLGEYNHEPRMHAMHACMACMSECMHSKSHIARHERCSGCSGVRFKCMQHCLCGPSLLLQLLLQQQRHEAAVRGALKMGGA